MAHFFIYCTVTLTAPVKAERNLFRLRAMPHSADVFFKFYLRLSAMPPSVKLKSKVLAFCPQGKFTFLESTKKLIF
jgi:hypothetical protein